ncbi:MAG: hypothetical protein ACYCZC_04090 [Acidithiobacillus sp.]
MAERVLILGNGLAGNAAIACSPASTGDRIICAMAPPWKSFALIQILLIHEPMPTDPT